MTKAMPPIEPPKDSIIAERFYKADQSWHYERIINSDGTKFRVMIRRNAYDDQSHINGYVYSNRDQRWNLLVSLPIGQAHCKSASYIRDANICDFQWDADEATAEMKLITSNN